MEKKKRGDGNSNKTTRHLSIKEGLREQFFCLGKHHYLLIRIRRRGSEVINAEKNF